MTNVEIACPGTHVYGKNWVLPPFTFFFLYAFIIAVLLERDSASRKQPCLWVHTIEKSVLMSKIYLHIKQQLAFKYLFIGI